MNVWLQATNISHSRESGLWGQMYHQGKSIRHTMSMVCTYCMKSSSTSLLAKPSIVQQTHLRMLEEDTLVTGRPNPYPWGDWSSMRFIALRAPVRAKLSVSCVCLQFTLLRVCGPRRGVFTQVSSSKDTRSGDDNWLTSLPASPAPVQAMLLVSVVFFGWPRGDCLSRLWRRTSSSVRLLPQEIPR